MNVALIVGVVILLIAAMYMGSMFPERELWQIIVGTGLFFVISIGVIIYLSK